MFIPFQVISCTHCGVSFTCKQSLDKHKCKGVCGIPEELFNNLSTIPAAFECDNCNRKFTLKHSLIRHIANDVCRINGRQSYLCNLCRKRFPTKELLSVHSRRHEREIFKFIRIEFVTHCPFNMHENGRFKCF